MHGGHASGHRAWGQADDRTDRETRRVSVRNLASAAVLCSWPQISLKNFETIPFPNTQRLLVTILSVHFDTYFNTNL